MTSLEYYIEQVKQFISALTDDIESGDGTIITQTKLAVYQEVLEHLEEIEQEPCEDAIDRKLISAFLSGLISDETERKKALQYINELPSVNPQPKTGHWIINKDDSRRWDRYRFYCSECGNWQTYGKTKYCPNCGAKMVEPQERSGEE